MKTIVISAVNLNAGGTLTILRDCLQYLSVVAVKEYRVVAIVYKRELADYPDIEYIETQWPKKRWVYRLWYEYVSMSKISKNIGPVYLWLSLHDTTPSVVAEKRAVYCHNPFPFHRWKWRECFLSPRIVLFALFSWFIYKKNIQQNNMVIVQQQWLKDAFRRLFGFPPGKIIVAPPDVPKTEEFQVDDIRRAEAAYAFIYPAWPNSHKNFECLCMAAAMLEEQGMTDFKVYITISGNQNRYSKWLNKNWGQPSRSLQFIGFQTRKALFSYYAHADCLVYPSKVETWGLPVSEFAALAKPMLLADLPYAHETAAGSRQVAFFDPDRPDVLAGQMKRLIGGDRSFLKTVPARSPEAPVARSWDELFGILLQS